MNLLGLVDGYLQAAGYAVGQRGADLVIGTRRAFGQETETLLIWVPNISAGQAFNTQEATYLDRFRRAAEEYPFAQKFLLVPSFEGISGAFRAGAKQWHNVNIRMPIQFFDSPFKEEESSEATSSAIASLRRRGESFVTRRVPQPYSTLDGRQNGEDLLVDLTERVNGRDGKGVHLVVGPAGIGKTVLFESLFSKLLSDFLQDKRDLRITPKPRPLPLIPDYLRSSVAPTVKALVEAFLATDVAAPVSRGVFEWMLTNGFAVWLLDGLDEVIARDPDFFWYLQELLTMPGGTVRPTVVVCVRDSLLATNDDIRDFCDEYRNVVEIYELCKWELASKRRFATISLGEKANGFISLLRERKELDELSSTPYYCRLLADQYAAEALKSSYTEAQLLDDAVSSIIRREYDKDLLDRHLIPETTVREFLESLSAENLEEGFQGIKRDAIEEWARIILPADLSSQEMKRFTTHIVQLALFSSSSVTGNVQFAQEILERYLLGAYLARLFESSSEALVRTLALKEIPAEWVTLKVIADHIRSQRALGNLIQLTYQATSGAAFKNLVQIGAMAAEEPKALRPIVFERQDISGIQFTGLDFEAVSFRDADLTDVEFRSCNLREAAFDGSIIKNTSFAISKDGLNRASFGAMERFYSLRTETGKLLADYNAVQKWLDSQTGHKTQILEPCSASRQLRYLFGKFIRPDGTARRSMVDERGALSGKRLYDPDEVLKSAVRHGYVFQDEKGGFIKRPDGDAYSEMVAYVKNLDLSSGLKAVLADVCPIQRCVHIPKQGTAA